MLGRHTSMDRQLDTRSLLYFIAVAEQKGICQAATRLHITQPALTRQIQSLEEEIGVLLFTRSASGMEITPSGSALLEHALKIRAELARAKTNALSAGDEQSQQFDIGVYGSAIFDVVPRILSLFSEAHPNVEFRLHHTRKDQQAELLRRGKTLIAFDRYLPQAPDLACELVYREYLLYVALHKDHPLAKREIIVKSDLLDEPQIGATSEDVLATKLAQAYGSRPRFSHRADDVLSALALVGCGLGISFAPPSLLALQVPNVVFRPYSGGAKIPFDVQCVYRKDEQSPLLHAMLETVRAFRSAPTDDLE